MLTILLLLITSTTADHHNAIVRENSLQNPSQVYVRAGSNLTLQSFYSPYPEDMPRVTWYLQVFDSLFERHTIPPFFTGVILCDISGDIQHVWNHWPLQFNCINKSLHIINLKPSDEGLYNVKVLKDSIQHNTYFRVHVISFPKPECNITTTYLSDDYCLINIDCSQLPYPAKVYYNGNESKLHYYLSERGGKKNLPNYFTVGYRYRDLRQNYTVEYPFNELCTDIIALETGADFTPIFIVTLVVSIIVIVIGITYLIYHCKTLKTKKPKPPEIRLL